MPIPAEQSLSRREWFKVTGALLVGSVAAACARKIEATQQAIATLDQLANPTLTVPPTPDTPTPTSEPMDRINPETIADFNMFHIDDPQLLAKKAALDKLIIQSGVQGRVCARGISTEIPSDVRDRVGAFGFSQAPIGAISKLYLENGSFAWVISPVCKIPNSDQSVVFDIIIPPDVPYFDQVEQFLTVALNHPETNWSVGMGLFGGLHTGPTDLSQELFTRFASPDDANNYFAQYMLGNITGSDPSYVQMFDNYMKQKYFVAYNWWAYNPFDHSTDGQVPHVVSPTPNP